MAIKEFITLEGVEVVLAQQKKLAQGGEEMLGSFRELGKQGGAFNIDPKPIQDLTGHTIKLKDALHTLAPILKISGTSFGELGAFARLASGNIALLATALTGVVVIGFGKLEENAARTQGKLDDLFGGTANGEKAFKALSGTAKQLGTTVDDLVPGVESLKRALDQVADTKGFVALKVEDLPSVSRDLKSVSDAYANFLKILRAGRLTQDEAEKSAKAFFDTFKEGGPLTASALQALPVASLQLLQQALGRGGQTAKDFFSEVKDGKISIDQINRALALFSPQADKAFDTKAIHTMGDELNKLGKTLGDAFQRVTGVGFSNAIIAGLSLINTGLNNSIKIAENFGTVLSKLGRPFQDLFNIAFRPDLAGAFGGTTEEINKIWEGAGTAAAKSFGKGFREVGSGPAGGSLAANFRDNPFFKEPIKIPIVPEIKPESIEPVKTALQTEVQNLTKIPPFDFSSTVSQAQSDITALAQTLWNIIQQRFNQPITINWDASNPFLSGQPTNLASGGFVRGSGSTTSDSILAFLSNREFVVNARAVSHYGSDLFAALNAMRLPKDFISRFSMGGLARALSTNRFAAGGQVSTAGNRSLTLVLDQKRFSMSGSKQTIDDLEREASLRGLAMIGKAPSWIR